MKKSFWALTKKEFFSYINAPVAYVILVPFTLITTFLFFRTALVVGDANLRPFIELLPWFLVVIAPAIAMRTFADENRKQTIELLYAHPVSEWTVVLAKFLGLVMFYGVFLLATVSLPITLLAFSRPDAGLMMAQYLGALAIGSAFLAIGMATSAYVASAVGAFLLGAAISFGLILLGLQFVVLMLPGILGRVLAEITMISHLNNLSRGVLDLRDLLYFFTITGIALAATVIKLAERKMAESKVERSKLWLVLTLIVVVGVVGNGLMYAYPIRLDVTQSRQFSLSSGTKQMLKDLPDRVTVTLYTSANLPGPMQATLRETADRLKDFARLSDRLTVKTVLVEPGSPKAAEAAQNGVREVQFNQIGSGSFAVQTGFMGMSIQYGDKKQAIEFIEDASGLEYQLARVILKLTREQLPKVGLVDNAGNGTFTLLRTFLEDQYELTTLTEESKETDVVDLTSVVVLDDGMASTSTTSALIKTYLKNNGNGSFFINGASVSQQTLSAEPSTSDFLSLLTDWGVTVNPNLVYDLRLNEAISLGEGSTRYILPYPYWIRAVVNQDNIPWRSGINSVVLGWASSLNTTEAEGRTVKPLLSTSQAAGVATEEMEIAPEQVKNLPKTAGDQFSMSALIEKGSQKIAVVGNTTVASDDFLGNSQENKVFVANMIDWAAADPLLASIPQRGGGRTVFMFDSPMQVMVVQYANILGPPIVVAVFGIWWLHRRRKRTRRVYAG